MPGCGGVSAVGGVGKSGHAFNDETYDTPGWISPGGNGGTGADAGPTATGEGGVGGAGACDTAGDKKGHCSGAGGPGGNDGAGAGGGILLRAQLVRITGAINNAGGSSTNNGGKVRIHTRCDQAKVNGRIITGRLFRKGVLMRPSGN